MRLLPAILLTLTITGPAQWQIQQSHTTASLRGIHSLGHGVAWASGTEGTVLRTTDDGTTWQTCPTPPNAEHLDFRGIQAFDTKTAIVMSSGKGDLSRLYKTTDACQTWKLVFTNPDKDGFWDAIRFEAPNAQRRDRQDGILVGDPVGGHFAIFTSTDFGESWKPFDGKHNQSKHNESLFAASNSAADAPGDAGNLAFVTGGQDGSYFYREDPGGLVLDEWMTGPSLHKVSLPFAHATATEGAFSLSKRRIDNELPSFMVVGGDYSKPQDLGYSAFLPAPTFSFFIEHQEVKQSVTPPHGYRSSVAYSPTHKAWITVGPNGTDLSTDDGRTWRPLRPTAPDADPEEDQHWNALSLPFVVGPKGRIGKLREQVLQP